MSPPNPEAEAGLPDAPPKRVVITGPRTRAVRGPAQGAVRELDEQTAVGEIYLRSLVRAQLRLALAVCAAAAVVLTGLPLLFARVPELRTERFAGLALPWLLLGALAYPVLVLGGWAYVRLAERTERRFAELVDRR